MYRSAEISKVAWDTFTQARAEANFLHSWQWGDVAERMGELIVRRGIFHEETLVGVLLGIVRDARRGRYLEVPGGPLIDWTDRSLAEFVAGEIANIGRQHGCVFVRLRPQLYESDENTRLFTGLGFRRAPMHLHAEHTNILHITSTEDELLAGMRRQTRYEVRRGDKQSVVVTAASDSAAIDEFFTVQADTARRQGFIPPSKKLLEAEVSAFTGDAVVYRAEREGELLNLALVLLYGREAVYFEAASTPEARKYPGAYAIVWQAIRDAKAAGCERFNFWGIAYSDDPNHRYAGVTTFKRGFGGDDVAYVPAHDLVLKPVAYLKNWLVETVRKKKRKL